MGTCYISILLATLGCMVTQCSTPQEETFDLQYHLQSQIISISSYITGEAYSMDQQHPDQKVAVSKDYSKAHQLLTNLIHKFKEYPKIIRHPIAQSTMDNCMQACAGLYEAIEHIPNNPEKERFRRKYNQLFHYLNTLTHS